MKENIKILYIYPQLDTVSGPIKTYSWCIEDLMALSKIKGLSFYVIDSLQPGVRHYKNIKIYGVPTLLSNVKKTFIDLTFMIKHFKTFPFPRKPEYCLDIWNSCRMENFMIGIIRAEGIDIIDSHGVWPKGSGGMIAKKETGIPLITNLYGGEILPTPSIGHGRVLDPFHRAMMAKVFSSSDKVIVANKYVWNAAETIGCNPDVLQIIDEGVNLNNFHPHRDANYVRNRLNLDNSPVVLCVASLIKRKGVEYCVQAFKKVKESYPEAKLILSGDGPEKAFLQTMVRDLELEKDVYFVNQERKETPLYFAACDVFCLASLVDAAPYVLLEAAATGKPAVSSDVPGIRDCVLNGESGFLVPPRDAERMAEKIKLLLADKGLRLRMGRRGRRHVEENFDFQRRLRDKVEVYKRWKTESV